MKPFDKIITKQESADVDLDSLFGHVVTAPNECQDVENNNRGVSVDKAAIEKYCDDQQFSASLFSTSPIIITEEYKAFIIWQRRYFLFCLFVVCIFSPLCFRFVMGARKAESQGMSWGAGITNVEWIILLASFFDTFNNILKALPMVSGTPTQIDSTLNCIVEGHIVLGHCSPFVSEDEVIFLRSLIGRSCTMFQTCGGRHKIRGLYIDTIMNERRLKGERHRKLLWFAWMKFITRLVKLSVKRKYSGQIKKEENEPISSDLLHQFKKSDTVDSLKRFSMIVSDGCVESIGGIRQSTFKNLSILSNLFPSTNSGQPEELLEVDENRESFNQSETTSKVDDRLGDKCRPTKNVDLINKVAEDSLISNETMSIHNIENFNPFYVSDANRNMATIKGDPTEQKLQKYPLKVNFEDILPVVSFLMKWLQIIKEKEWTYNYNVVSEAIESIFLAAPFLECFHDNDIVIVHKYLNELYDAFISKPCDDGPDDNQPIFRDDLAEINWELRRQGFPNWDVKFHFFSRARLRLLPTAVYSEISPVQTRYECTQVLPGSIVYLFQDKEKVLESSSKEWFQARMRTYKVRDILSKKDVVVLEPFPLSNDMNTNEAIIHNQSSVSLLEQNRGKAGALNEYRVLLKKLASDWKLLQKCNSQVLLGITDARHMPAEPTIFWNEALPYFSISKLTGKPTKRFGKNSSNMPLCVLVQYPQFFTNVTRDDFLDNKNSAYYTLWQTLRDAGKVITSSGSNAIWDVTSSKFRFATTSRIEDTGTTHNYLYDCVTVHLPVFVAYGIAKKTEDYLEAVYRWGTGAVELMWDNLFSSKIYHFLIISFFATCFGVACFVQNFVAYYLWLGLLIIIGFQTLYDKHTGRKPLRPLLVSSVIVVNCMNWVSNLLSITWMVIIPAEIAFWSRLPLSSSIVQSMFWMMSAVLIRFPCGIMADRMIQICGCVNPHTTRTGHWNYHMTLWRSSQLFACSFAYTILTIYEGTVSFLRAIFFAADLTMWQSFRVSDTVFERARDKLSQSWESRNWGELYQNLKNYFVLQLRGCYASIRMPDRVTKWYSVTLLIFQVLCIFVSCNFTNFSSPSLIIVTLSVCGLNILLVADIAMLLYPSLGFVFGRPARPEYVFAVVSIIVLVSIFYNSQLSARIIKNAISINR